MTFAMSTTVFTQLSETEIQAMFRQVLESFFADKEATITAQALPEIGGMDLAMEITGLKRPSIYGLTSTKAIPHYRQGKRLYFKRSELVAWIESGRKLTTSEIVATPGKLPRRNNNPGRN